VKSCQIAGILTRSATEALLALAAHQGGGNARDLLESFAAHHPCDRIQFAALREMAIAAPDVDTGLDILARGTGSPVRLVAEMSRQEMNRLQAGRDWIEGRPVSAGA
jgi:hypothetical protein